MRIFLAMLCCVCAVFAKADMELRIYKKGSSPQEKIFLLLGGIQGDEPGGFNAAAIVASDHYKILNGSVWIVPNLNQHSILENHRGIYGDMNRKFAKISDKDPEKPLIESIKSLITHEGVEVILHLHDGSGFYHETHINNLRNPNRWGQSSIIDQDKLENVPHGDLDEIVKQIIDDINLKILSDLHRYRVRNTHTATSDKEQQKSLTFYAISQGKAAFANEASKNLPLDERVYYHLLAIEAMMKYLGIEFERDFPLTPQGVRGVIADENITITFDNKITLPINRLKSTVPFFPMPKNQALGYESNSAIVHLYRKNGAYLIKYGNKVSTTLQPDFFDSDDSLHSVKMTLDDDTHEVAMGSIVKVKRDFRVESLDDPLIRVNIIGFSKKGLVSEEGVLIKKEEIAPRYTLDKKGQMVRVEFYKNDRFCGMVIVDFVE